MNHGDEVVNTKQHFYSLSSFCDLAILEFKNVTNNDDEVDFWGIPPSSTSHYYVPYAKKGDWAGNDLSSVSCLKTPQNLNVCSDVIMNYDKAGTKYSQKNLSYLNG